MPFKLNDDGVFVLTEEGLPIFIGADGSEKPYDVDAKAKQIAELTEKANKRGQEIKELTAKYALLEGIEDIAAYVEEHKKNSEAVAAMADKDRAKEAGIQKRIEEAVKSATTPIMAERDKLNAELEKTTASLNRAVIGNAFANSKYAAEKLVNPALASQLFENRFYVKDGRAIGRDADGNDMYGAEGIATFDEALCKMVESSPFRENIVKPTGGGAGTDNGGSKHMDNSGGITPEQAGKLSMTAYNKARNEGRL